MANKKKTNTTKKRKSTNTKKRTQNTKKVISKDKVIKKIEKNIDKIVGNNKKENKLNINITILIYITLLFSEIVFRIFATENIFPITFIYILLFLIPISIILSFITSLFNKKTNLTITKILFIIIALIYSLNMVYKIKLGVYFSIDSLGLSNQVKSFMGDFFRTVFRNLIKILILFVPTISIHYIKDKIKYIEKKKVNILIYCIVLITSILIFITSLLIKKNNEYSIYNLCFKTNNNSLLVEKTGVSLSNIVEINKKIFKQNNDVDIQVTKILKKEEEIKYNTVDIDFDTLFTKTTDKNILTMNEYFKNQTGTKQNKYTGMFKNKNLILFMAESFNSFAVSESLTPTLYKLSHEGFVFENYYSPVILSTIGGEFQELTGLYPHIDLLSKKWRNGTNYYEYGLGKLFSDKNYNVNAYHNNQYNFQNRDSYLNALGFTNYTGCGNGLETKINCKIWPESDSEMINATINDYVNSDSPFMTYYVTVSGHMAYNWKNEMSKKHRDKVEKLNYPEDVKAYIATQIELDEALKNLINKLEESGKLDDTVIALVGDHYPYDISIDNINKASSYERDSVIEINHSNFILWNNKTKTKKIKKVGSQIDVLPTILNLFDIKYDSRLIIGKDILSDNEGLAIFNNNSWVSDKGKYFSATNTFIPNDENFTDYNEYVKSINEEVNNRVNMSRYIIENDYYNYIFNTK